MEVVRLLVPQLVLILQEMAVEIALETVRVFVEAVFLAVQVVTDVLIVEVLVVGV